MAFISSEPSSTATSPSLSAQTVAGAADSAKKVPAVLYAPGQHEKAAAIIPSRPSFILKGPTSKAK